MDIKKLLNRITVLSVDPPLTVLSPKGRRSAVVSRERSAVSFCEKGRITYYMNGESFVSEPGCAVILPKGGSYSLVGDVGGRFPIINFDCEGLDPNTIIRIPVKSNAPYLSATEQLHRAFLFDCGRVKAMGILYSILDRLCEEQTPTSGPLARAMEYLERNLYSPALDNASVAESVGLSEVYFRKLFRSTFGISPRQYVIEKRIERAKELLLIGGMSIGEVAIASGFSGVYHFSRSFRERVGLSPTEYIAANRLTGLQ